jgi:hypothetical protein
VAQLVRRLSPGGAAEALVHFYACLTGLEAAGGAAAARLLSLLAIRLATGASHEELHGVKLPRFRGDP